MYRVNKPSKSSIKVNSSYVGETIEQKLERIVNNGEPISDNAPIIYTERKDGVMPEYDIRTDRFEVAVDAMDKVSKSRLAKREERLKAIQGGKENDGSSGAEGGTQSLQGTDPK